MIAIKNMTMPESCYDCRLLRMRTIFDITCRITDGDVFHNFDLETKPDWCPLVELPEDAYR